MHQLHITMSSSAYSFSKWFNDTVTLPEKNQKYTVYLNNCVIIKPTSIVNESPNMLDHRSNTSFRWAGVRRPETVTLQETAQGNVVFAIKIHVNHPKTYIL